MHPSFCFIQKKDAKTYFFFVDRMSSLLDGTTFVRAESKALSASLVSLFRGVHGYNEHLIASFEQTFCKILDDAELYVKVGSGSSVDDVKPVKMEAVLLDKKWCV